MVLWPTEIKTDEIGEANGPKCRVSIAFDSANSGIPGCFSYVPQAPRGYDSSFSLPVRILTAQAIS